MTDSDEQAVPTGFSDRQIWLRGLATAGALILALLFAALIYLVVQSNDERDAAALSERQSFETIMAARSIEESIAQSEAALGRFIINGDSTPATIYRNERREADRRIDQLQRVVRDFPEQAERAQTLEDLFNAYAAELAVAARLAANGRNFDALARYNSVTAGQNGADQDNIKPQKCWAGRLIQHVFPSSLKSRS